MLNIELLYAPLVGATVHEYLSLPDGSHVQQALEGFGLYEAHPETRTYAVGIYAQRVSMDTLLRDGDRIEIYRPLRCDPKEKRRRLATCKR